MKSEKGITLISLIVYVVAMAITIAIISVVTTYFYNNVNLIGKTLDPAKEYTKFNSFFSEEVNKKGTKVLECNNGTSEGTNYILFSDGTQYTFKNENVYKGKVKIAEGIANMKFSSIIKNGKEAIIVEYTLKGDTTLKKQTYTLIS